MRRLRQHQNEGDHQEHHAQRCRRPVAGRGVALDVAVDLRGEDEDARWRAQYQLGLEALQRLNERQDARAQNGRRQERHGDLEQRADRAGARTCAPIPPGWRPRSGTRAR